MNISQETTPLILAGGQNTRLREIIGDLPKALVPVQGRPFITYLLDRLLEEGFEHAVISIGYGAKQVRRALGDEYRTLQIVYSEERSPLGTGGAIFHAMPLIDTPLLLVMNGDTISGVDLQKLYAAHLQKGALATITLVATADASRFGTVEVDTHSAITVFGEKQLSVPGSISAGVYLFDRALFAGDAEGYPYSLEREMFPRLVGRGLYGFESGSTLFLDIGTPASLQEAEHLPLRGEE